MAKIDINRLSKKYGKNISGASYQHLIKRILLAGNAEIATAIAEKGIDSLYNSSKRAGSEWKNLIIPDVKDIVPKSGVFIRKSAESGREISQTLYDSLRNDLYNTINEVRTTIVSGPTAGLSAYKDDRFRKAFQEKITETFKNYTDTGGGIPSNIKSIAITETRSYVNGVRHEFVRQIRNNNPDIAIEKEWVHNAHLSQQPRPHHQAMNGVRIPFSAVFVLPNGVRMRYPHDDTAPANEIISCHCELRYKIRKTQ